MSPGDTLQIKYRSQGKKFGFLFSIDGNGVLSRHLPLQGKMSAVLAQEPSTLLDYAYILDDAPKWEKFYLVTSNEAFKLKTVIDQAKILFQQNNISLDLDSNYLQTMFIVKKRSNN